MSDLTRFTQYEHLDKVKKVVAIGGGHGLGRLMSALSFMKSRLTGIVTTTDNGGSTGRIRLNHGGIAWGDLRNCLNQIITEPSTASSYRYQIVFNGFIIPLVKRLLMRQSFQPMQTTCARIYP